MHKTPEQAMTYNDLWVGDTHEVVDNLTAIFNAAGLRTEQRAKARFGNDYTATLRVENSKGVVIDIGVKTSEVTETRADGKPEIHHGREGIFRQVAVSKKIMSGTSSLAANDEILAVIHRRESPLENGNVAAFGRRVVATLKV